MPLVDARRALREFRQLGPAAQGADAHALVARLDAAYARAAHRLPPGRAFAARRGLIEDARARLPRRRAGLLAPSLLAGRLEVLQGRAESALRRA